MTPTEPKLVLYENFTPRIPNSELVERILKVGEALSEKKLYSYQIEFGAAVIEAMLMRDGLDRTILISRQAGKTFGLAVVAASIGLLFPVFAKLPEFENDPRFNLTDDKGNYRGYKNGVRIGIYAPKQEQATIMFGAVSAILGTNSAETILREMGISVTATGAALWFATGTVIRAETASENAKIEGDTYNLIITDESQDISDERMEKSLGPMLASTLGLFVKCGTANTKSNHFFRRVRANRAAYINGAARRHFEYNWVIAGKENSNYRKYVEQQMVEFGEYSDYFQQSYMCLLPETPVVMADGSNKPIEDVKVGDQIFTHSGKLTSVTFTASKQVNELIVGLHLGGAPETVWMTKDHRVWTTSGWKPAGEVVPGEHVRFPRIKVPVKSWVDLPAETFVSRVSKYRGSPAIPQKLRLSSDLGELLGWYVAEGFCNQQNRSQIVLSLSKSEIGECSRISDLFRNIFGLRARVFDSKTVRQVSVCSAPLNRALTAWFGHGASNKSLPAWLVFESPPSFAKSFLRALFAGDGTYSARYGGKNFTAVLSTSSRTLADQVTQMLLRLGVVAGTRRARRMYSSSIDGREIRQNTPTCAVSVVGLSSPDIFSRQSSTRRGHRRADLSWLYREVRGVTEENYSGSVHDLSVEHSDESFLTPFLAVHNCKFLLDRGMFITESVFTDPRICFRDPKMSPFANRIVRPLRRPWSVVVGIDLAKQQDSTVCTAIAVNWDVPIIDSHTMTTETSISFTAYEKHVIDWFELQGDDWETQYHSIMKYLHQFGGSLKKVLIDGTGVGDPIVDRFATSFDGSAVDVQGYVFTPKSKSDLFRRLHVEFCGYRITYPGSPETQKTAEHKRFHTQMLDLQKEYVNGNLMRCAAPPGPEYHDDFPCSLALANWAAENPWDGLEIETSENMFFGGMDR